MKKHFCLLIFSLWTQLIFAADLYKLDPEHTYVIYSVSHFGFSTVSGKLMAYGNLLLDSAAPQNSKLNAAIDLTQPNTGVGELDDILTGKHFFNVPQNALANFVSTKLVMTSKTSAKVYGNLTLCGVTKPIVLTVKLNKTGIHPYYKVQAVGFTAEADLNRSDFGLKGYLPGVSDKVHLFIQAEAEISK